MSFRTIVIENQSRCSYKSGYLVVRTEHTAMIHLSEISCIVLESTASFLSTFLLSELAKKKIPVIICDEKHNPVGEYLPLYGAHNTSKRIAGQLEWGEAIKKRVWQHIVKDKIYQQARHLEDKERLTEAKTLYRYLSDVKSGDSTNREAHAAKVYFNALLGKGFNRNQPNDINAALDYGYSVLLSSVNKEIVARGFLTQQGIFHRNEYNQFNLACDFMEPFRPVADRLVADILDLTFSKEIRRLLADIGNQVVAYRDGSYKLGSVMSFYVQDCLNALEKKITTEDIDRFEVL